MKKIILAIMAISIFSTAIAQKKGKGKGKEKEVNYKKIFYIDTKAENSDLVISIDNAVSTEGETKFKLKITNKTNDYIIYKPEESTFTIEGKEIKPNEKILIISPNESDFRVINLKGAYNTLKNYSFVVGGLYKASSNSGTVQAPDFKLPPSQNDFRVSGFNCGLVNLSKASDKTDVKFRCSYNGDKVGFIYPSRAAVRMPDGNDYANAKAKAKPIMLMKGEDDSFVLSWERMPGGRANDMQIVNMIVKWNDTFSESSLEKMNSEKVELQFDEALSNAKGK